MGEEIKDVNKQIDAMDAAVKKYASKDTVISIGGYEFTPTKLMVAATISFAGVNSYPPIDMTVSFDAYFLTAASISSIFLFTSLISSPIFISVSFLTRAICFPQRWHDSITP